MLRWQKDHSITIESFHAKLSRADDGKHATSSAILEGKFLTGIFTEEKNVPEFCDNYEAQVRQVKAKQEAA